MPSRHVYVSQSSEKTKKIAQGFAKKLITGDVLCLYGDLGNGKTTFVQGLGEGLGIKKRIISPTFTIVRQYKLSLYSSSAAKRSREVLTKDSSRPRWSGSRTINFFHVDLYRTSSINDIKGLGLEEILNDKNAIIAIEWAENLGFLLPKKRWNVRFEYIDESERKITIKKAV